MRKIKSGNIFIILLLLTIFISSCSVEDKMSGQNDYTVTDIETGACKTSLEMYDSISVDLEFVDRGVYVEVNYDEPNFYQKINDPQNDYRYEREWVVMLGTKGMSELIIDPDDLSVTFIQRRDGYVEGIYHCVTAEYTLDQ